jgi:hypothetical protein
VPLESLSIDPAMKSFNYRIPGSECFSFSHSIHLEPIDTRWDWNYWFGTEKCFWFLSSQGIHILITLNSAVTRDPEEHNFSSEKQCRMPLVWRALGHDLHQNLCQTINLCRVACKLRSWPQFLPQGRDKGEAREQL